MAVVVTTQQLVSALYVAIFNRAPDKAGLDSWVSQIAAGKTFASVATGFTGHEVFTQGIGTLGNAAFINALYTNVLGSAGDAAGVAGWVAQLNAGASKASVAASFVQAALTVDIPALLAAGALTAADAAAAQVRQDTLTNKANVGIYFTTTLGAASNLNPLTVSSSKAGLEADPIYNASKAAIANVTNTAASVQTAKDAIAVAAGTTNPAASLLGGNVTLTTAVDNITGTAAADTYTAFVDNTANAAQTLTAADKINGGAGIDTLNVVVAGTATSATNGADISNIEIFNVRNIGGGTVALDAATTPGLTTFVSDRSSGSVAVTNLAAGGTIGVKGNGAVTQNTVTATYVDAATAANVTLDGGVLSTATTPAGLVTVNGTGLTSATITSTGAANSLAGNGITFGGAVKAVTIDAQTNISTGNIGGLVAASSITVKGAGTANVGLLNNNVTVVDASANTGGLTAGLNTAATLVVTGTAGNDTITTGAVLATGANINVGAGTADRLVISNTAHLTAATAPFYKGFEQVQVGTGTTADVSLLSANNTVDTVVIAAGNIATGAKTVGVTGLTAAQAAAIQITGTSAVVGVVGVDAAATNTITIGVTNATVGGQIDTVKAALTTTTTTGVANNIDLTNISLAGIEKLALTANATAAATAGTVTLTTDAATSLDSITLTSAGVNSITIASGHTATNLAVDASASTGNTTINASAYSVSTGATLTGGAGNDVLLGSAGNDRLVGGAGNDLLANGAATITAATATAAAVATKIATSVITSSDTLTGGAGNDSFLVAHAAVANVSSITDLNLGTNVVAGTVDSLWFNSTTDAAATVNTLTTAQQTTVTGLTTLAAAVDSVLSTITTANTVAQFTYGTDTYLVANGTAGAAIFDSSTDSLIKITGVTGVLDASDIHFLTA